jgi:hypothetical protein
MRDEISPLADLPALSLAADIIRAVSPDTKLLVLADYQRHLDELRTDPELASRVERVFEMLAKPENRWMLAFITGKRRVEIVPFKDPQVASRIRNAIREWRFQR